MSLSDHIARASQQPPVMASWQPSVTEQPAPHHTSPHTHLTPDVNPEDVIEERDGYVIVRPRGWLPDDKPSWVSRREAREMTGMRP